jgi:hypothetical protein
MQPRFGTTRFIGIVSLQTVAESQQVNLLTQSTKHSDRSKTSKKNSLKHQLRRLDLAGAGLSKQATANWSSHQPLVQATQ